MEKVIPVLNLILALSAIYLKLIYGELHLCLIKLVAVENLSKDITNGISFANSRLWLIAIFVATISTVIAGISIYEKFSNRILGIILLGVSLLSFVFALVSV